MDIDFYIKKRDEAKKLARKQTDRLVFARQFLTALIKHYTPWGTASPVEPLYHPLAKEMGAIAVVQTPEMAAYLIGTTYTVMLPEAYRGRYGVFYTPPSLASRLLDLSEKAGTNWRTARILDPACGGGAFLAPVASRMLRSLQDLSPAARIEHVEQHLSGYEIDPFSAWVSQIFVEMVLQKEIEQTGKTLKNLVTACNSLYTPPDAYGTYDLVIGNPPYGRQKLSPEDRTHWSRSLYGHANLYGLFTDLAVRLTAHNGVIAYITPTSFLGGQYFQALRRLLGAEAPPLFFDFIAHREGVFADALQETMLSIFKKHAANRPVSVSYLSLKETGNTTTEENGQYNLPEIQDKPWVLPRNPQQSKLAKSCGELAHRLKDVGYTVSTGPLVWNRHKSKLFYEHVEGCVPVIWAECVNPSGTGEFIFKASLRNHAPWFKPSTRDEANIVRFSCILLQRTTSLEQSRRLIAAELPQSFIEKHGGAVTVENHLNMVKAIPGREPLISPRVITALLNSTVVDQVFRCMNGSTAVSAYELESMPIPPPEALLRLEKMIARRAKQETIDKAITEMYAHVRSSAAA